MRMSNEEEPPNGGKGLPSHTFNQIPTLAPQRGPSLLGMSLGPEHPWRGPVVQTIISPLTQHPHPPYPWWPRGF